MEAKWYLVSERNRTANVSNRRGGSAHNGGVESNKVEKSMICNADEPGSPPLPITTTYRLKKTINLSELAD